jgi:chemotaxis protein methyltransferase CheR
MSREDANRPALTEEELRRFCEYLYRRTGMTFGESKRYYIDRRVAERMNATGDVDFRDYFVRLRSERRELEYVINAFTINETYFYREAHQFACMSRELLPALVRGREAGSRVRILCNPCATGEEPYSVALWLLENWALVDAYNIEIVGADVDTAALGRAREGWYEPRSLSRLPPELVDAYFDPPEGDRRRLIRDLRESVSFTSANLIEAASMRALGAFDILFCRNVLIYFDDAARRTAAEHLYDALSPGGFLLLGHSESMSQIDDRFSVRRFEDAVVYQRPTTS